MFERIIERLAALGYLVSNDERSLVLSEMEKTESFIKASCNVSSLSEELLRVLIERTCGNFLFIAKNLGHFEDIDGDGFVKEILEGDVKVVFDENSVLTTEQRIDKIIDFLMGYGEDIIISKRCVCW